MNLRCCLLSLLRIHHSDCKRCNARETCGDEMRKRLEELNWRTNPQSLDKGDRAEGSKPGEVVSGTPVH